MRYFLGIVGILGFCDFMIFPSRRNTLILRSCIFVFLRIMKILSLIRGRRHNFPNHVKSLVHLYVDFFIFVFLNIIFSCIKASAIHNKWYQSFKLKISTITKDEDEMNFSSKWSYQDVIDD